MEDKNLENKNLENLFERLHGTFDTEEPKAGHRDRFLERLDASKGVVNIKGTQRSWWQPWAMAASIALLCAITFGLFRSEPSLDQRVAEISPEVSRTQFYFAGLVEEQVMELEKESTPETRRIIDDTMVQLKTLEADYTRLERDLVNGGNSKLILSAMITNFRTRIDLLQEVLYKIETIKKLNIDDDAEITI